MIDSFILLQGSGMVATINAFFMLLALSHLAYLGVMFGAQSENDKSLQAKVCV